MASSNSKNKLKQFAVVSLLVLSFLAIYYVSTDSYQERSRAMQKRADAINKTEKARKPYQIVLKRNERYDIGRTSLVYRGVKKNTVLVDLYLLDLDPQQSYRKKIKSAETKKEVDLGGVKYHLISANDRYLTLKVVRLTGTP